MDLLHFLKTRLRFVERLYGRATSPFTETMRKIEAEEAPYVDLRNPEYVSEPAFLEEWQEAEDSVQVIGHWCLCWVQASLQCYLRERIGPLGPFGPNSELLRKLLAKKEGNWFEKYRLLFLEELGVDWKTGPVPLKSLEELNLTRDDLTHNVDILRVSTVERTDKHVERYPTGLFVDEAWAILGVERLKVDREKLAMAVQLVETFCTWLDSVH